MPARPQAPPESPPEPRAGSDLADLLEQHRQPGRRVVLAGVGRWTDHGSSTATHAHVWDEVERVTLDARRTAALCQALASEPRLALLLELLPGARTTGELTGSTGLERGQLYHHLRDLFLQGLVTQRERGSYELTGRGQTVLLLATVLADAGPDERSVPVPEEFSAGNP